MIKGKLSRRSNYADLIDEEVGDGLHAKMKTYVI
jgi:hypothetical protein